jgi:hypothetical protein
MGLAAGPAPGPSEYFHLSPQSSPQPSPAAYSAQHHPGAQGAWPSPVHPLSQAHSPVTAYFPCLRRASDPQAGMAPPLDPGPPPPGSAPPHGLLSMDGMPGLDWSIGDQTFPLYTLDPTPAEWDWEGSVPTPVSLTDYPRSPADSLRSARSTESSGIPPFPSSHHPSPPSSRSDSAPTTLESGPYLDSRTTMSAHAHAEAAARAHPLDMEAPSTTMAAGPDLSLAESPSWISSTMSQEMHQLQAIAAYYHQAPAMPAPAMHMPITLDLSPPLASRSVPPPSASGTMMYPGPAADAGAAVYSAQLAAHQTLAMRRAQHGAQVPLLMGAHHPEDFMLTSTAPAPGPSAMFGDYPGQGAYMAPAYAMSHPPPAQQARPPPGPPPARTVSRVRPTVVVPRQGVRYPPASAGPGPAPPSFLNTSALYGAMGPLSAPVDGMGMHGFFEAHPHGHPLDLGFQAGLHPQYQYTQAPTPPGSAPPHLAAFSFPPDSMAPHMHMPMGTPPPLLSHE